jgi:hypothetical protein
MRAAFNRPLPWLLLVELAAAVLAWLPVAPLANPLAWGALAGLIVLALAPLCGVRGWAHVAGGLFWPLVGLALQFALPPWMYLLAFVLTLGFGRNALTERVPLYRSSAAVLEVLAERLPPGASLLEAGCGDARLALALARRRPDLTIDAVENAWLTWCWAKLRWWLQGRNGQVRIRFGSFWQLDWSRYGAIYVFLSPAPMPRVWRHFVAHAAPDSLLLSNTFTIPGEAADETLSLGGPLQQTLMIWRRPYGAC